MKVWPRSDVGLAILCIALSLAFFVLDSQLETGLAGSMLQIIPAFLSLKARDIRTIYIVAVVATVLTVVAVPLKPPGDIFRPLFHRPLTIFIIWVVALLGAQSRRAEVERERLLGEVDRYSQELRSSNAELQQFAYVASHDLKEPLRMVASYLQLLERRCGDKLDDDAKVYISFAVDGATRMDDLIRDLLTYSRVGTTKMNLKALDINQVMYRVRGNLKKALEESGAKIFTDDLPTVFADETQIIQLLQNLVSNAVKYRGSEPPVITVAVRELEGAWLFSVQDNGIGIPKDQQGRLFQMFSRLHTRDEYEGTGIGLAIAKRIVERHGGHIWVESEEGKGSTFYFTISKRLNDQAPGGPSPPGQERSSILPSRGYPMPRR